MEPMSMLVLAAAVFLGTHFVSSTPLRSGLVGMLGEKAYLGAYSLVSLLTVAWMVWAYARAPYERLWAADEFKVWAVVLMPVSLIFIAAGGLTKNPSAVRQEGTLRSLGEPRGILRVTRHPIQWGIALWALLHVIARGDEASLIFFGGFALLSILGTVFIDRPLSYAYSVEGMVAWAVIVLVLAAVASLLPAWRASRLAVREILAYE